MSSFRSRQEGSSASKGANGPGKPLGKALIVGGGPAGALAAKALSDRNYDVTLCEAYPHPSGSEEKSHAYVICVSPRGIAALRRVGVDPLTELEGGVVNYAYVRHGNTADSDVKIFKKGDNEPTYVIRRQKLTAGLLRIAEEAGAEVVCGERLVDIDVNKRVATFTSPKTGKETKRSYDLLVGTDGVKSVTRTLLEAKGLIGTVRKEDDDMEYQVAILPSWRMTLSPAAVIGAPDVSIHTYADRKSNSSALVFPLDDGNSLVCVICPGGRLGSMKNDNDQYGPSLQALFPNWSHASWQSLATQLAAKDNVPTTGGTCIWTSALGAPEAGVVLVGDSGHAMFPSLGQGCNAALESVAVLTDAVEAVCGTGTMIPSAGAGVREVDIWSKTTGERARLVAEEYQGLRHEDALAVVDLTFGGIGSRRTRGAPNGKFLYMAQVTLMMLLNVLTLKLVPKPALLRVMGGDLAPYSALLWQHKCEKVLTYAVLIGVAVSIVSYGLSLLN
mmetsp:Transcript_28314/g.57506  ORF Transcript_28314/g.57506 Transcript_28314/m.57506 type:complete len:502 (-) Transcript_28314:1384-2889(-)